MNTYAQGYKTQLGGDAFGIMSRACSIQYLHVCKPKQKKISNTRHYKPPDFTTVEIQPNKSSERNNNANPGYHSVTHHRAIKRLSRIHLWRLCIHLQADHKGLRPWTTNCRRPLVSCCANHLQQWPESQWKPLQRTCY